MRVTDKVNEEKRRQDNAQAVTDLAHRVEDWKGHDLSSFGQLLLHENFVVIKSDNEREYSVYLFERIILCCKEVVAQGNVIVWGRLNGVVHAGAGGDTSAVVCALDLAPTQLRIDNLITRSPRSGRVPEPELACIREGQIVAERWAPKGKRHRRVK